MRGVISSLNTFLFFCWVKKAKVNQVHNTEYEYKNEYIQLEIRIQLCSCYYCSELYDIRELRCASVE